MYNRLIELRPEIYRQLPCGLHAETDVLLGVAMRAFGSERLCNPFKALNGSDIGKLGGLPQSGLRNAWPQADDCTLGVRVGADEEFDSWLGSVGRTPAPVHTAIVHGAARRHHLARLVAEQLASNGTLAARTPVAEKMPCTCLEMLRPMNPLHAPYIRQCDAFLRRRPQSTVHAVASDPHQAINYHPATPAATAAPVADIPSGLRVELGAGASSSSRLSGTWPEAPPPRCSWPGSLPEALCECEGRVPREDRSPRQDGERGTSAVSLDPLERMRACGLLRSVGWLGDAIAGHSHRPAALVIVLLGTIPPYLPWHMHSAAANAAYFNFHYLRVAQPSAGEMVPPAATRGGRKAPPSAAPSVEQAAANLFVHYWPLSSLNDRLHALGFGPIANHYAAQSTLKLLAPILMRQALGAYGIVGWADVKRLPPGRESPRARL